MTFLMSVPGLAIVGTLVTVFSILLSELFAKRRNDDIDAINSKSLEISNKLDFSREMEKSAKAKFEFAQLLLAIVQSAPPSETSHQQFGEVVHSAIGGIADRNSAVTLGHPSEAQVREWSRIRERAAAGDGTAFQELNRISQELLLKIPKTVNPLVEERQQLQLQRDRLSRDTSRIRYLALGFQILGLILVLLKDLGNA